MKTNNTHRIQNLSKVKEKPDISVDTTQKPKAIFERRHTTLFATFTRQLERFVEQRNRGGPLQLITTIGSEQELHPVTVAQRKVSFLGITKMNGIEHV